MSYLVKLRRSAEKELDSLPGKLHNRIVSALSALKENPLPIGVKKLQGREGYRIRIGGYRVLYVIDKSKKVVDVFSIADRKEVYRL
jgi:mRNA interferase RelE/StbE